MDIASLIQTSGSAAVLLTTVYNTESNIIWNYCNIEPLTMFITNPTCADLNKPKTILIPIWILVSHSRILIPGFCNLSSKVYIRQPPTWKLIRVSDTVSNLVPEHLLIDYGPEWTLGIRLYIHTEYSIFIGKIVEMCPWDISAERVSSKSSLW